MWIDVKIPYEPGSKLGKAYNRAMQTAGSEWVLLLDHDILFLNPYWYQMSMSAIKQVGDKAGWITCYVNRVGGNYQRWNPDEDNDDIIYHMKIARDLFAEHGDKVQELRGALSGFFILTNKTAWKRAGKFNEKRESIYGVDSDYSRAVRQAGFTCYIMPGLYCYHIYRRKRLIWGEEKNES